MRLRKHTSSALKRRNEHILCSSVGEVLLRLGSARQEAEDVEQEKEKHVGKVSRNGRRHSVAYRWDANTDRMAIDWLAQHTPLAVFHQRDTPGSRKKRWVGRALHGWRASASKRDFSAKSSLSGSTGLPRREALLLFSCGMGQRRTIVQGSGERIIRKQKDRALYV